MKKRTKTRSTKRRTPGRRNRKLKTEGFRMPATLSLVLVMSFMVGGFYIWVGSKTEALAQQIKEEEQELKVLRQQVASAAARWSEMTGPRRLQAALAQHNLEMNWPRGDQIVQIRDMALWESNTSSLDVFTRVDRDRERLNVP